VTGPRPDARRPPVPPPTGGLDAQPPGLTSAERGIPMTDAFDALLDRLADQLADRLLARIDVRLDARASVGHPDAYRPAEVAEVLRLSRREIGRHLASGRLRSVRVGRLRLIPRSAVADFLAERDRPARAG
jgi:excisionase family DNA binding protein